MNSAVDREGPGSRMPRGLKWAAGVTVVLLLASALLLLTARGEAMLLDLATAVQMICF